MSSATKLSFDTIDLREFGKLTRKTVERLSPWIHLRNYSSPEGAPIVARIVEQVNTMLQHIDQGILSVLLAHRFACDAVVLCNLIKEERWTPATRSPSHSSVEGAASGGSHDPETYDALTMELYHTLTALVEEGKNWSIRLRDAFRVVDQDLYKIAADTKDKDYLVEVPRDPTSNDRGKQLFRQLSTVGSDLVASLKLFTELHDQAVILAEWWTFLQVQIGKPEKAFASAAMTEILPMSAEKFHTEDSVQELAGRWSKVKAETFGFYNTIDDVLEIYSVSFPVSLAGWRNVLTLESQRTPAPLASRSPSIGSLTEVTSLNANPTTKPNDRSTSQANKKLKSLANKFKIHPSWVGPKLQIETAPNGVRRPAREAAMETLYTTARLGATLLKVFSSSSSSPKNKGKGKANASFNEGNNFAQRVLQDTSRVLI